MKKTYIKLFILSAALAMTQGIGFSSEKNSDASTVERYAIYIGSILAETTESFCMLEQMQLPFRTPWQKSAESENQTVFFCLILQRMMLTTQWNTSPH